MLKYSLYIILSQEDYPRLDTIIRPGTDDRPNNIRDSWRHPSSQELAILIRNSPVGVDQTTHRVTDYVRNALHKFECHIGELLSEVSTLDTVGWVADVCALAIACSCLCSNIFQAQLQLRFISPADYCNYDCDCISHQASNCNRIG